MASLLEDSMPSSGFMTWEQPRPGQWVTRLRPQLPHVHGRCRLRFDTSGGSSADPRWQAEMRSTSGYASDICQTCSRTRQADQFRCRAPGDASHPNAYPQVHDDARLPFLVAELGSDRHAVDHAVAASLRHARRDPLQRRVVSVQGVSDVDQR